MRWNRRSNTPVKVMPEGACADCGKPTRSWTIDIDPKTKRRHKVYRHHQYECSVPQRLDPEQVRLREERAREDWEKVTDPILNGTLILNEFPEQYPGPTRMALRAFQQSDEEFCVVPRITANTLNQSIETLGLSGELYAEQRGKETVLRRVSDRSNA